MKFDIAAMMDELDKIATSNDRPITHDFLAGVDPTGTYTSIYGIADARKSEDEQRKRKIIGVLGGTIGGAFAIPMVISGMIGAAKGLAKGGIKGGAEGLVSGALSPITGPVRATKGILGTQLARSRGKASEGLIQTLDKILTNASSKVKEVTPAVIRQAALRKIVEKEPQAVINVLKPRLTEGLAILGISGVISGGSAYLQYGKGIDVGKTMTEKQVKKYTGL